MQERIETMSHTHTHTHTAEYYSDIKQKMLTTVTTQSELEGIMLSEIR